MAKVTSIELTATEPGGADRRGFPLTVGVPFAQGVLAPDQPVVIVNEAGEAQPLQSRVLENHVDGSVRWLLLDYQADFTPLGTTRHALRLGQEAPDAPEGNRIEMKEEGDVLVVDNGVLKLEVDRSRCRPLVRVWHEGRLVSEGGLEFWVTADDGGKFLGGDDSSARFEIEESGSMRLLMRWEGTHREKAGKGHFDFLVRMTVYAGNRFVRIEHVFFNRLDPDVTNVKEVVARFPLALGNDLAYTVGDVYRRPTLFSADGPVLLDQSKRQQFRIVRKDGKVLREAARRISRKADSPSMGWLDVSGAGHGVLLAGRDFWQNYPKAIAADDQAFHCYLIPEVDGGFDVPMGMAKSHTFFLTFHDGKDEPRDLRDLAFLVQRWPMPAAPSEYYQQSGAFWDFFPHYDRKYPRIEAALRAMFEPDLHHLEIKPGPGRAYGLKHYGDFLSRPSASGDPDAQDVYYLNNEYDTPHVLAMLFLRTREIVKWWGAEVFAQHMMDIDTRHHTIPVPKNDLCHDWKELRDCQYRHCYQHIGSIQLPDETRHVPGGGSHTFAEGLLDRYHLTGDRRALDVAVKYAHHLSYPVNERGIAAGIGRISGWALLVMGGVYSAQPHEYIRKAADTIIDSIIAQQQPDGGVLEANIHPKALEDRKIHLCMRGMIKWHQASGCAKTRKLIVELMEAYLECGLLDEGLPVYSNWPESSKPTTAMQGFGNLESLAYAYDLTGDRRFFDAGVPGLCHAVQWMLDPPESDLLTDFQRMLRGPFRFMAIAHELGVLEKVPGAGDWLNK